MKSALALIVILTTLPAGPARAADEICARLQAFAAAPFDGVEKPAGRRWVEVHWIGSWASTRGAGIGCEHSDDQPATNFCAWLPGHSSFEFPGWVVDRMLECDRHKLPNGPRQLGGWIDAFGIRAGGRRVVLEANMTERGGEYGAVRVSAFASDKHGATTLMPPPTPLPTSATWSMRK